MTEQVVLTGPISPPDIEHLLTGRDGEIARSLRYGGVSVSELVKALVAMDVVVEVVTGSPIVNDAIELQGPNLRLLIAPRRPRARDCAKDFFRRERKEMIALLSKTESAVIHANWTYEYAWAALDTGRPVLVTARDAPLTILRHVTDKYRLVRAAMAWIVRMRIQHLTAVSPYLKQRWQREMLYRREIAVIPNISPAFSARPPSTTSLPHSRIVAIANASRHKNVRTLVEAIGILRAEGRTVELDLVGAGLGSDDALAQELRSSGLAAGIEFHGYVDREGVADVLSLGAVFVHPSLEESFGLVLVEAINAGLPVVAGENSGAVPWVLANGEAGILVDVRKPEAIARGITRLLDDESEAREIVARAQEYVAVNFNPQTVCNAYLEAYDRLRQTVRVRKSEAEESSGR